jgi:hypothetical protein
MRKVAECKTHHLIAMSAEKYEECVIFPSF